MAINIERTAQTRMRVRSSMGRLIPLLVGVTTVACGAESPHVDEAPGPSLASVGTPVEGVQTSGALPRLANFPENNESGYMSTWVELSFAPSTMNKDWVRSAAGEDGFTAPTALSSQLGKARDQAEKAAENARVAVPKAVTEIVGLFDYYKPESGENKLVGYTPERARWLSERSTGGKTETFADPYSFAEMRQRGAHLYCAASAAYNHRTRNNRLMGKTMSAGVSVFGLPLDLTVVEPTITMAKPMRFDSGNQDGAQSFVVPFEAGVRMRPVSFLPGLPELKIPVGFVTADSELASRANVKGNDYEKWMTMSHMDGFASLTQPYFNSSIPQFDFLTLGPITFSAKVSLDMGAAACAQGADYADCKAHALNNPGRLLASTHQGAAQRVGWPGRPGGWTTQGDPQPFFYNDGPWDVDTESWWAKPKDSSFVIPTRLPDPLAGRMLQNNDKSMEVHTSSGTSLSLIASGGLVLSWIEASASAHGSIRAGVNMVHRFREQEEMVLGPRPSNNPEAEFNEPVPNMVTSFTVTPASAKEFTFGLGFGLTIKLKLGFLEKEFSKDWTPLTKTLSSGLENWTEDRKLRMDTALSDGTTANFNVGSHWPRDAVFPSYETLDGCQAPQTAVVPADPPCAAANRDKPKPADFKPIQGNVCLWREEYTLPPDFVDSDLVDNDCWLAMKGWFDAGVSQRQKWHESEYYVVARTIALDNPAEQDALHTVLTQCDTRYGQAGRSADLGKLLHFQFCDGAAKLVDSPIEPVWSDEAIPAAGAAGDPDACD